MVDNWDVKKKLDHLIYHHLLIASHRSGIQIFTAEIDDALDEDGMIVPG